MELLIKGGYVFDPLNGVDGERMDVCIRDGKVVESVDESKAKVIDASGMTVMPGGVDIHSHIAGSKVNLGRLMRPEDHRKDVVPRTDVTRSGVGYSVPSTFVTGYRYALMGYTTVVEPAGPPLGARHVHEELNDTPIIDKAFFPLMGNNYFVLKYVSEGDVEKLKAFVAWLLWATKDYAVKIVNPGGVEMWKWGKDVESIDDVVEGFGVTPRQIVVGLARANESLGLPHTIHVHCNNLGVPGNYETTIETMEAVRGVEPAPGRKAVIHVTHVQFNAFAGKDWRDFRSGGPEIVDYLNKHEHVTVDVGQIDFTDTTTMTADGPWQFRLYKLTGNKWINSDVELETGAGIVPYTFKKKSPVNAVQWAIGLEVMLLVKDLWRVFLTTDHPNGAPFTHYPRVIAWLMSRKARSDTMAGMHGAVFRKTEIADIYREYTLYEVAVVTRAATAKALSLRDKGHLGVGADADVAVYPIDPNRLDSSDYRSIEKAFSRAKYVVKGGEIVVWDGRTVSTPLGSTFWVRASVQEDVREQVLGEVEEVFEKYYTMKLSNYPVQDVYLPKPVEVRVGGG